MSSHRMVIFGDYPVFFQLLRNADIFFPGNMDRDLPGSIYWVGIFPLLSENPRHLKLYWCWWLYLSDGDKAPFLSLTYSGRLLNFHESLLLLQTKWGLKLVMKPASILFKVGQYCQISISSRYPPYGLWMQYILFVQGRAGKKQWRIIQDTILILLLLWEFTGLMLWPYV